MSDFRFEGFEPANTTPVPDVLFDVLLSHLKEGELRVLLYIIRRTAGFKKDTDAISLTQFEHGITTRDGKVLDKGCGLSRPAIIKALKSLEEKGCITRQKRKDPLHLDDDVTLYSIHFKNTASSRVVNLVNYPSKITLPPVVNQVNQGVVNQVNPQETVLQETVIQETEEEERVPDVTAAPPCAPSSISMKISVQETKPTGKSQNPTLTQAEQHFWELWCNVSFNKDIPPALNQKAYEHVQKLAHLITTQEDIESQIEFARKELEQQNAENKSIHLGNLVNCYSRWKQARTTSSTGRQRKQFSPETQKAMEEYAAQQKINEERNQQRTHERAERKRAERAAQEGRTYEPAPLPPMPEEVQAILGV